MQSGTNGFFLEPATCVGGIGFASLSHVKAKINIIYFLFFSFFFLLFHRAYVDAKMCVDRGGGGCVDVYTCKIAQVVSCA